MLLIRCPYCNETLPEAEFTYDEQWEEFLFIRENVKGPHFERWRHLHGCGRFFNAVRDTVSDRFLTTYRAGEPRPELSSLTRLTASSEVSK